MNSTGLATTDFWEHSYLADVALPARPDPAVQFERILMQALATLAPVRPGDSVIEIGCAPATWMGFYAERFDARVAGIEYTHHGADLSRRNLRALGVEGDVVEGDFFTVSPKPYDLVLSLGFIEHFEDLEHAFAHHAAFVAPGGALVLGVPNYRGLLGWLQRVGDRGHLDMHNLSAMEPSLWRRLAPRHGLRAERQVYLDGLDPAILAVRRRTLMPLVLMLEMVRSTGAATRLNGRWLSAYHLTVLRRPLQSEQDRQ